jgi:16S rRNA (guanine(966)-N(2))-methyltransferase RsmD
MRITGGAWRGRQLQPIKGFMGRPTTDFAREGLFNLLNTRLDLEGADVLDLFAGTGMIGIGCASRGAGSITLVEKHNRSCKQIKEHFMSLGYERAVVVTGDCFSYIQKSSLAFDFVFADPPFDMKDLENIPGLVNKSGIVKNDGVFVLEHGERMVFSEEDGFVESRKFGHVVFSFFNFES